MCMIQVCSAVFLLILLSLLYQLTLGDKITLEVLFNASLWLFCDDVYTTFAVAFIMLRKKSQNVY